MECMAILGQRQEFADGVHDYCCYLRDALAEQGVTTMLRCLRLLFPAKWTSYHTYSPCRQTRILPGKLGGLKGASKSMMENAEEVPSPNL
jgi:hypothetical protein